MRHRYLCSLFADAVRRRRGRKDSRSLAEVAAYTRAAEEAARYPDTRDVAVVLDQLASRARRTIEARDTRDGYASAYETAANMARNAHCP
jgi:hypothetical protein